MTKDVGERLGVVSSAQMQQSHACHGDYNAGTSQPAASAQALLHVWASMNISGAERHKKVWVSSCPEESVHCRSTLTIPIKQCRVMIGYLLQPLCTSCCCLPATVTHLLGPAKRMQQCTRESVS